MLCFSCSFQLVKSAQVTFLKLILAPGRWIYTALKPHRARPTYIGSMPMFPCMTSPKFFWENELKGNSLVLRMAFSFYPVTYWARVLLELRNYILVDFFVSRLSSLVVLPSVTHMQKRVRQQLSAHGVFSLLDWRTSLTLFFNFQALLFVWLCHTLWEMLIDC